MSNPASAGSIPSTAPAANECQPWWKSINRYHCFVFAMASMAWLVDCLDQQLFIIARNSAINSLLAKGGAPDVLNLFGLKVTWGSLSTSIFVAGWATGGLIFGAVGDRIGRARTLTLMVLLYSVFTGLSSFAGSVTQFMVFR